MLGYISFAWPLIVNPPATLVHKFQILPGTDGFLIYSTLKCIHDLRCTEAGTKVATTEWKIRYQNNWPHKGFSEENLPLSDGVKLHELTARGKCFLRNWNGRKAALVLCDVQSHYRLHIRKALVTI